MLFRGGPWTPSRWIPERGGPTGRTASAEEFPGSFLGPDMQRYSVLGFVTADTIRPLCVFYFGIPGGGLRFEFDTRGFPTDVRTTRLAHPTPLVSPPV